MAKPRIHVINPNSNTVVTDGLAEGDVVVTSPATLAPGSRVRPRAAAAAAPSS